MSEYKKKELLERVRQKVDDVAIDTYQKLGVLYIPQLLTSDEVECLKMGIETNLQNLSPRAKIASASADPGLFVEDFCTWQNNPYYQQIILASPLAQVAKKIMKSKTVRLYHDHMLTKEPFTEQITPWHQDQPYYNIDGMQNCSMWIPVDPVAAESTLKLIPGSHLGPWYMPRSFMDNKAKWFTEGSMLELPSEAELETKYGIAGWAIQPGDVVIFHMLTIHAAAGVPIGQRRRVFSVRFMGDDIRHMPRPWPTSPNFPGLAEQLPPGAPMEHELFPLL